MSGDHPSARLRVARLVVVICGLAIWFWTQSLIGAKAPVAEGQGIGDAIHEWTAPWNAWLQTHASAANALLIASSAGIDAMALFVIGVTIFGRSVRPFLGLILLFGLRQICQALCSLPPPDGIIWRAPGFPSLLVTYGVANDLFFSGHTALAVYGAMELARIGRRPLVFLAVVAVVFELSIVLVLRAHYTMDVFAGAMTALLVAFLAERAAGPIDRWLARMIG